MVTEVCKRRFIALSTVEQACTGACYLGQRIAEIKIKPYGEKVDFESKSFQIDLVPVELFA